MFEQPFYSDELSRLVQWQGDCRCTGDQRHVDDPDAAPGEDGMARLVVRNQGLNVIRAAFFGPSDQPKKHQRIEHTATLAFTLMHAPDQPCSEGVVRLPHRAEDKYRAAALREWEDGYQSGGLILADLRSRKAAHRKGGVMVVSRILSCDEWEALAAVQQDALIAASAEDRSKTESVIAQDDAAARNAAENERLYQESSRAAAEGGLPPARELERRVRTEAMR